MEIKEIPKNYKEEYPFNLWKPNNLEISLLTTYVIGSKRKL